LNKQQSKLRPETLLQRVMHLGRYESFSPDHQQNSVTFPDQIISLTFQVTGNPETVYCWQSSLPA